MTDNLLYALEEKIVTLLSELENLRQENQRIKQENGILKSSQLEYTRKLQGLIALLDSLEETPTAANAFESNNEEYATA